MPNDLPDLRETAGAPIAYWAILVWDPTLNEKRVMGIYLEGRDANIDAMAMEGGDTGVTVEPCYLEGRDANIDAMAMEGGDIGVTVEPWLVYTEPRFGSAHEPAWETPPIAYWAILAWDPALKEKRVTGIYLEGRDANIDAQAMTGGGASVTVEPWLVYTEPRFGSAHEPAWETNDDDFDVAIQGDDL